MKIKDEFSCFSRSLRVCLSIVAEDGVDGGGIGNFDCNSGFWCADFVGFVCVAKDVG